MSFLRKAGIVVVGSLFLSIGINFFLIPHELLDGGIIGIGLIIKYVTGMKAGLAIMILSLPIFLFAWFYDRRYFYNSLHGMLFSSFLIDVIAPFRNLGQHWSGNPVISSVIGGILVGIGIGLMLRYDTSTGGTDLLAQFLSKVFRINVGMMIFIIDALVIGLGGLLLSSDTFLLSAVAIIFVGIFTSLITWNHQNAKLT